MNQTEEKRLKDQKAEKMSRVIQCAAWKIILFAHAFLATYFAYLLIDLEIISVILLLLALAEIILAIIIKNPIINFKEFLYPQPTLTPEDKKELREKNKKILAGVKELVPENLWFIQGPA